MGRGKLKPFRVWSVFDTETTNHHEQDGTVRAFPILYIFNDVHLIDMDRYELDHPDEQVTMFRHEEDALAYIDAMIMEAREAGVVPIMCAYNAIFDLQTILYRLHDAHDMKVNAQSSTNIYTLDLLDETGHIALRIWDTYHLDMRGLKAMGRTCGVAKLMGDWDYSLVRTPETPLTEQELAYAKRDTQVIPAYLRYLCDANEWLTPDMLGCRVLTKTSLVRQMARHDIGPIKVGTKKRPIRLIDAFVGLCKGEQPKDYDSYALRLSCFRGGLTFTAASVASVVLEHVCSIDETSAHHAFINGRRVPIGFEPLQERHMSMWLEDVADYTLDDVLYRYAYPFQRWFHIEVELTNVRPRKGSCFERWGIGLLAQAKFTQRAARSSTSDDNERHLVSEDDIRARGYGDSCEGATFAFGKLMRADRCVVHVTELEWWCMCQVYEWDGMRPLRGEGTIRSMWPPDYVTLQSNVLFERKQDAKHIDATYVEGEPYVSIIPATIPEGIAEGLRVGELSAYFLSSWYTSTTKGLFNSIYGTQAQNLLKPEYTIDSEAELEVNQATKATPETYDERIEELKSPTVLYTYGMRIVGGSRMQLVIALMLLWQSLGERVTCCGGDTDSIKVRCDLDVTTADIQRALDPLHVAITGAIDLCMSRVRKAFPDKASTLDNVGCFEVEQERGSSSPFYAKHMEAWNKARVSITQEGHAHITCAGLSRPSGSYHVETWLHDMMARGFPLEVLMQAVLGYNVTYTHAVCHAMDHHKPLFGDIYEGDVIDYLGNTAHVRTHEAVALMETNRKMGDLMKNANAANVEWLRNEYGRTVDTSEKVVTALPNIIATLALALMGERCTIQMARAHQKTFWIPKLYKQTEWGMEEVLP